MIHTNNASDRFYGKMKDVYNLLGKYGFEYINESEIVNCMNVSSMTAVSYTHLVVKSFNKEKDMVDTFDKTNAVLYSSAWKSQFFSGMMQPIMMFVGNLGYAGVALSGGMLAINGCLLYTS